MARESREIWIERVERWRASGQTAKAFAEASGVNVWTLRGWCERLKREGKAVREARTSTASRERAPGLISKGGLPFVEMIANSVIAPSGGDRFEVVLRENRRVYVPARFDAEDLRRLLAVLEAC